MKTHEFISSLVMHFPVRHESSDREMEWLRSMIEALKHYDGEVLKSALQRLVDTRTDRRFPLPAEIRKACNEVVEWQNRHKLIPEQQKAAQHLEFTDDRIKLANGLVCTEMGRTAAREGWILGLWDYARKHGQLPTEGYEIANVQRGRHEFDEGYAIAARSSDPTVRKWLGLGDQMIARRESLARMVLGEHA